MIVYGAVLAAGGSTRLGRPKQLVELAGEPLVARAARIARASRCTEVAVVLGAHAGAIAPVLAGVTILDNAAWAEGMASSVRAAVQWATGADALLVMLCDQPSVTTAHLDALIELRADIVASSYAGTNGVPAVFARGVFPTLLALTGDRGARDLLRGAPSVALVDGERDIDTPDDLSRP